MVKTNSKPRRLNAAQIDSVKYLQKVLKAVYVMRSDMEISTYRFGGIGLKSGNTPIRRLGQCTHVKDGKVEHTWHYVAIAEFPPDTPMQEVRDAETVLRRLFIGTLSGRFFNARVPKKDMFTASSLALVLDVFDQVAR